jgi:hypothetical protein
MNDVSMLAHEDAAVKISGNQGYPLLQSRSTG